MPIALSEIDDGIGVLFVGKGSVNDQEYIDVYKDHLTQAPEKFKKYKYSFSDFSAVTSIDISTESIEYIVRLCNQAAQINPHPIVALVSGSDLGYGLSRMFEILLHETNWEVMVFRSKIDAIDWVKERVKAKFGIDSIALD